ncbi:hypothetical protein BH23THE1_BH23THE1_25540 [soil metagenome]
MVVKRIGLMAMPFLFLIIGISTLTFMFIPVVNIFSLTHENQNSNNSNLLQLAVTTNSALLKLMDLYILSQHLNNTTSNLMGIADVSMNGSNSFGNIPLVNVTSEM